MSSSTTTYVSAKFRFSDLKAEKNWWGTSSPSSSKFVGLIDWDPYLTSAPSKPGGWGLGELTPVPPAVLAQPNPFHGSTQFKITGIADPAGEVRIFDLQGRLVRKLIVESDQLTWDGYTDLGRTVTSGIYFYKVLLADHEFRGRLVVVR